ncbi:hypothetical protein [Leptolyngbya sp. 7M]|uniref:hypothetical protein n=1 Tax=Leptolyngbya sp. 7M TaxID=2812896 RepID=UPI001B8ACEBA|nr:hypothetical protein [Leptolyngbya sp. 7M]QYO65847.1 hypothetical protein JVX88_03360 [Leptolyngbya sp. 7M]
MTSDDIGRDSPVFFTSGADSAVLGCTTISFVSVGREFGEFTGRDDVRGLDLSVSGGFVGWLMG